MPLFCRLARTLEEDRVGVNLVAAVARKSDRRAGHQSASNGGKVHRVFLAFVWCGRKIFSGGIFLFESVEYLCVFFITSLFATLLWLSVVCNSFIFYFENKFHVAGM